MRVITGSARSVRLISPEGLAVRPTSERVKEAVFSIIQFEVEGRRALDLFAGSGQMGIEALSRGAAHAVFVDNSAESVRIIRENLSKTRLASGASIHVLDAAAYLHTTADRFDIAFLDPPYDRNLLESILPLTASVMRDSGTILCEFSGKEGCPEQAGSFSLVRVYEYSRTKIALYRKRKGV